MKNRLRANAGGRISGSVILIVFALGLTGILAAGVCGQAVLIKPKIQKGPTYMLKIPNLIIMDLAQGATPNSVYVQVGNAGTGNAGTFYVRLSLKTKGSTTKRYVEKRISGLNANTDLPLNIDIGQPISGLEIGVFVDARKQIAESEELNCGKLYPGGGVSGLELCKDF